MFLLHMLHARLKEAYDSIIQGDVVVGKNKIDRLVGRVTIQEPFKLDRVVGDRGVAVHVHYPIEERQILSNRIDLGPMLSQEISSAKLEHRDLDPPGIDAIDGFIGVVYELISMCQSVTPFGVGSWCVLLQVQ